MSEVCVVGLGKIGLPLACAIARSGHRVRGADIAERVVGQVNAAEEPFPGEMGLADALAEVVHAGTLTATTDTSLAVEQSEIVIVVVPLVVDAEAKPDFRAMDAATASIAAALQPGTLVSYETTLPVGTTRRRFAVALAEGSRLTLGKDLFVVHSPERVFSGRIFEDLRRYPKLVGGVDSESARLAAGFYESFLQFDQRDDLDRPNGVWDLGSAEAAELAKLAETTYRDINIAYANELAMAAEDIGVDVYRVIEACNSQPFSHIHRPGVSVGGHCIPVYPHFLVDSVSAARLAAVGRSVNTSMISRAVARIVEVVGTLAGQRVVVLGLSYRPGVKEHAFSGAFPLVDGLSAAGAQVAVHDPLYSAAEIADLGFMPFAEGNPADIVVLHTDHEVYGRWGEREVPGARLLYDGRASADRTAWSKVLVAGVG